MKNFTLLCTSFFLISTSCIKISGSGEQNGESSFTFSMNSNAGKGPVKEKTITGTFTGVAVSSSIRAEIYKSAENKVVISAPDDILDFIEAVVDENGTVKIGIVKKRGSRNNISTKNVLAKVYLKNLTTVTASSSATVSIKDKFTEEKIDLKAGSSSEITGNLEANYFSASITSSAEFEGTVWADEGNIAVSSSGTMQLKGKIQNADIAVSSSGDFDGEDLEVKRGSLKSSSSGSLKTGVSVNAVASASSSGSIAIKKMGNPEISQSTSSSGSINLY